MQPPSGSYAVENFGDLLLKNVQIKYFSSSQGTIFANEGTILMDPEVEIMEVN